MPDDVRIRVSVPREAVGEHTLPSHLASVLGRIWEHMNASSSSGLERHMNGRERYDIIAALLAGRRCMAVDMLVYAVDTMNLQSIDVSLDVAARMYYLAFFFSGDLATRQTITVTNNPFESAPTSAPPQHTADPRLAMRRTLRSR